MGVSGCDNIANCGRVAEMQCRDGLGLKKRLHGHALGSKPRWSGVLRSRECWVKYSWL